MTFRRKWRLPPSRQTMLPDSIKACTTQTSRNMLNSPRRREPATRGMTFRRKWRSPQKKRQMALSAPIKTCATQNISTQIKMRRRSSIRSLETTPVLILRLRLQLVICWPPIAHIPTGWGDQEKTDVQEGSNNSKQQHMFPLDTYFNNTNLEN